MNTCGETKYIWGRRHSHENLGNGAYACLFSMVILVTQKQLRSIFGPLLSYLSSFCSFCGFLSRTFAFCPISSSEMNIEFQCNCFNYFIHTFYINYCLCHCKGSCPHVCTNNSVWKLAMQTGWVQLSWCLAVRGGRSAWTWSCFKIKSPSPLFIPYPALWYIVATVLQCCFR